MKLVYTRALGARGAIRESSSLSIPTKSSPKANGRDENAGVLSSDAEERARPRGGG